jgi:hypothetical protein
MLMNSIIMAIGFESSRHLVRPPSQIAYTTLKYRKRCSISRIKILILLYMSTKEHELLASRTCYEVCAYVTQWPTR